jgi:hypothetical protein
LPGSRTALRPASITRRFGPLSSECECNRTPHGIRIFVEIFDLRLSPMGSMCANLMLLLQLVR